MILRDFLPAAAADVGPVVKGAGGADLSAPTPCSAFDLRTLVNHVIGTTGALARVGRREALDAGDPYGARLDPSSGDWQRDLAAGIDELAAAWSDPRAWTGTVDMGGGEYRAALIGEMAMAEILLHGWDLARATGQHLTVTDEPARELRRSIEQTAELGRAMGAYGPAVTLPDTAGEFERALAASGRDPSWHPVAATSVA